MPLALDLPRGEALWTPMEQNLYHQLPIYFAKQQIKYQKLFDVWNKFLKPFRWTPNQGNLMRGVRKERSPILRGQALPNKITVSPTKDVIQVREVQNDMQLYRKLFDSKLFHFLPSFKDFLTDHVDATEEDMVEKIMCYKDLFYRTAIFHGAPTIYVCGAAEPVKNVAHWTGAEIALTKTAGMMQDWYSQATGGLTLQELKKLLTIFNVDIGATAFSGDLLPDGTDGSFIGYKYVLLTNSEVWNSFTDEGTFLLENKALNLDIVTGPFKGSLFGQSTTMIERFEQRIVEDGTVPAPETIEENPEAYNFGETVNAETYKNAGVGVAYLIGFEAYKAAQIGPPPSEFANGGAGMTMEKFNGMNWSGKIMHTRNVQVPVVNQAGDTVMDTNYTGEYLKLWADVVMGICPVRRRNVLPIIYKRTRAATPTV